MGNNLDKKPSGDDYCGYNISNVRAVEPSEKREIFIRSE
jgi:hypothetical protein